MAQPQPDERTTMDQILKLVEELSPEERMILRGKLDQRTWAERWDALVSKVRTQSKNLRPMSDEEIAKEMRSIRNEV